MAVTYKMLADLVVVVHFAYVAFVILGLLAVLVGVALGWGWTRNVTFRVVHLAAIGIVVAEALLGITCPLTTWENSLRQLAGESTYRGDFIATWVHNALFFDCPPWGFTLAYCLFGLAVLATFIFAPPRFRRRDIVPKPAD